jgi:hypothetical protein
VLVTALSSVLGKPIPRGHPLQHDFTSGETRGRHIPVVDVVRQDTARVVLHHEEGDGDCIGHRRGARQQAGIEQQASMLKVSSGGLKVHAGEGAR